MSANRCWSHRLPHAVLLALVLSPHMPAGVAAQETRSGMLARLWRDAARPNEVARSDFVLIDQRGEWLWLDNVALLEQSGLRPGEWGTVTGTRASGARQQQLVSARPTAPPGTAQLPPQNGLLNWVTILCKFPDSAAVEPRSAAAYRELLSSTRPGMDHYWRELSENRIGIIGQVVGWYTLPQPHTYYFPGGLSQKPEFQRLLDGCTGVADADVDFEQVQGINLQLNISGHPYSWATSGALVQRDGILRSLPVTWLSGWAHQNIYAHEMGHGLGLPHSSGTYDGTCDSKWDVMSGAYSFYDTTLNEWIGQHTIGAHKDQLAWVPESRKYTAEATTERRLLLERGGVPPANGYVLAQMPQTGRYGWYYTVEARDRVGYDVGVPAHGIVIHKVDSSA